MKKLTVKELQKITQEIHREIFPSCLPYEAQERVSELVNTLYLQAVLNLESSLVKQEKE